MDDECALCDGPVIAITVVAEALRNLETLQQPDGRWPSEDGAGQDVHTTLESLRALFFARSPGG